MGVTYRKVDPVGFPPLPASAATPSPAASSPATPLKARAVPPPPTSPPEAAAGPAVDATPTPVPAPCVESPPAKAQKKAKEGDLRQVTMHSHFSNPGPLRWCAVDPAGHVWAVQGTSLVRKALSGETLSVVMNGATSLAVSGDLVWAGDGAGDIHAYRGSSNCVGRVPAHTGGVTELLGGEGGKLISGGKDGVVLEWSTPTEHRRLTTHKSAITCLGAGHGLVFSGSTDGMLGVWHDGVPPHTQLAHPGGVLALCISNRYLWSGGADKAVCIWEARTQRMQCKKDGHVAPVTTILPVGSAVWTMDKSGVILVWKQNGVVLQKVFPDNDKAWEKNGVLTGCVVASLSSSLVWTTTADGGVRVWCAEEPAAPRESGPGAIGASDELTHLRKLLQEREDESRHLAVELARVEAESSSVFTEAKLREFLLVKKAEMEGRVQAEACRATAAEEEVDRLTAELAARSEEMAMVIASHQEELAQLRAAHADELLRCEAMGRISPPPTRSPNRSPTRHDKCLSPPQRVDHLTEVLECKAEMRSLAAALEASQLQKTELSSQVAALQRQLEASIECTATLHEQVEALDAERTALRRELDHGGEGMRALETALETAKAAASRSEAERTEAVQRVADEMERNRVQLNEMRENLNEALDRMQGALTKEQVASALVQQLKVELSTERSKTASLKQDVERLTREVGDADRRRSTAEGKASEQGAALEEVMAMRDQLQAQLTKSTAHLEASVGEVTELRARLASLEKEVRGFEGEREATAREREEWEMRLKEAILIERQTAELSTKQLTMEIEGMRGRWDDERSSMQQLVDSLQRELEELRGPWAHLHEALADTQSSLAAVQSQFKIDIRELEDALQQRDAEIAALRRSSGEKDSQLALLRGQISGLMSYSLAPSTPLSMVSLPQRAAHSRNLSPPPPRRD